MTPLEIEEQLSRLGPKIEGSPNRHPGATRFEFRTHITYAQSESKCRVSAAYVAIKANVILPRWRRMTSADVASRMFWDVLSADIARHEESHLVIGRNYARTLERALLALPQNTNCEALAKIAQTAQDKALARHDAEQQRFDRIESGSVDKRLLAKLKRRIDVLTAKRASGSQALK